MSNMVWTVTDGSTNAPLSNAEVSGNYSSGNSGYNAWLGSSSCSTGSGTPVEGYTGGNGQYVVNIPYTCGGGNYTVTVKANGYNDQSVTTLLGPITGDVYQTVKMTKGLGVFGPPGQGLGASGISLSNTGSQAWGEYAIWGGIAVAVILVVIVVLRWGK